MGLINRNKFILSPENKAEISLLIRPNIIWNKSFYQPARMVLNIVQGRLRDIHEVPKNSTPLVLAQGEAGQPGRSFK